MKRELKKAVKLLKLSIKSHLGIWGDVKDHSVIPFLFKRAV